MASRSGRPSLWARSRTSCSSPAARWTTEEIERSVRPRGRDRRYDGILGVSDDPLVSADIVGDPRAAIVDLELTRVVDGTLVTVMAWYDSEWGFTHQMIREAGSLLSL